MEKIVKTTYHVPVLEYANNGWQGTVEMYNSKFDYFETAALYELVSEKILKKVIDDCIVCETKIRYNDWIIIKSCIENFFNEDSVISELFANYSFDCANYRSEEDLIREFTIILSTKNRYGTTGNIYITFEY